MKKLLLFIFALVLMSVVPVQAANVDKVKAAIVKHSIEMGVDPAITLSIAKTESGYKHETKSTHGAVGVFQLMPSTARRMGLNPYSLDDNIKGGIMYYKSMYKMFGSMELAVAAYNAGPAIVKRYNSIPPYRETKRFVSRIMSDYYYLKAHTDPAVLAYRKSQEKPAAQLSVKQAESAKIVAQKPVVKEVVPIVAKAPAGVRVPVAPKAAVSVQKIEQSRGTAHVLHDSPIESGLSVQM